MPPQTRHEQFTTLFPQEPSFRWQQIEHALFQNNFRNFKDVTTLPKNIRETINKHISWLSVTEKIVLQSTKKDTYKAILTVPADENGKTLALETVLMQNTRSNWTICVSSQIGCAMACTFCATGKMGFTRNLTSDEIIDQYRFWKIFLNKNPNLPQNITNIVFMGMGEPLANYDNVKAAMKTILDHTAIGPTKITVSTVGLLPRLEYLINDPEWPHTRLAVSLHSADRITRHNIMPTSYKDFLPKLAIWAKNYLQKFGTRNHHLTFEYIMLAGVNDSQEAARQLANFVNRIGHVKVNLIPYNTTAAAYTRSQTNALKAFQKILTDKGVTNTLRKTMGDDIAAACGQLITEQEKKDVTKKQQ